MLVLDTQLTAGEVLRAFHRDQPKLILGAAITTVSVIALGICAIRRRFDPLLVWLAVFACLYGVRLWIDSEIFNLTIPQSGFFRHLRAGINPLIPIPAFIFFQVAGLLPNRRRIFVQILVSIFLAITVLTFIYGRTPLLHTINNVLVVIALISALLHSIRAGSPDRDFVILRRGMLCFVAFAL